VNIYKYISALKNLLYLERYFTQVKMSFCVTKWTKTRIRNQLAIVMKIAVEKVHN